MDSSVILSFVLILSINGGNKHEFSQKEDKSFCVFPDDRIYDHAEDI
jgi:hypothetical protein